MADTDPQLKRLLLPAEETLFEQLLRFACSENTSMRFLASVLVLDSFRLFPTSYDQRYIVSSTQVDELMLAPQNA